MHPSFKTLCVSLIALTLIAAMVSAQGTTAFNFQGQLKLNGKLANGSFDFEFSLYDGPDPLIDTLIGIDIHLFVAVRDGNFGAELDFGPGVFDGTPLWLRICVRESNTTQLTCLDPLQPINPVPYSTFAVNASELDGHDSTDFLRRNAGCKICIGHADSFGSQPEREQCFNLSSNGRSNSQFLQFPSDVDENDRVWIWLECP